MQYYYNYTRRILHHRRRRRRVHATHCAAVRLHMCASNIPFDLKCAPMLVSSSIAYINGENNTLRERQNGHEFHS